MGAEVCECLWRKCVCCAWECLCMGACVYASVRVIMWGAIGCVTWKALSQLAEHESTMPKQPVIQACEREDVGRWVSGWMGEWVDGWMHGCMDGWMDGCNTY